MKFVSYVLDGRESFGIVTATGIVDLRKRLGVDTLREAILGDWIEPGMSELPGEHDLDKVVLLPPIPRPGKIICFGLNYHDHAVEVGAPIPEQPQLFSRFSDTLVGHGEPMVRPKNSDEFDYEGELALVIGRPARHVQASEALSYVFGYTCFNDGSVRDFQRHALTAGKNFPSTGGIGPWIVTANEVGDPAHLQLTTRRNGQVVQSKSTGNMIFSIERLIEQVTSWTALEPGDIISTGTPEGVGMSRHPPLWLKPGDRIEVTISRIGTLSNTIADEFDRDRKGRTEGARPAL